ncbi:MAG: phosphatidate cytidylyltransferase [Ferruginibacter sp.]|nr:phosphatidate cytidylyltransferase [Ferruginibacter sp.]
MNRLSLSLVAMLSFFTITLSSCEAIGSIFKAGIWTGVIAIVIIVALVLWLIGRSRK